MKIPEVKTFPPHVVLDTNVLYGQVTRRIFLALAQENLCYPHWSDTIVNELSRAFPTAEFIIAEAELSAYPAGLVKLADVIPVGLPDPADEHVLACVRTAGAQLLITHNKRDFPQRLIGGLSVQTPNQFLESLPGVEIVLEKLRLSEGLEKSAWKEKLRRGQLQALAARIET